MRLNLETSPAAALAILAAIGTLLTTCPATAAPAASESSASSTNPLWPEHKTKNYLPEMRWPEVQDLLRRSDIVVIPMGALEQHGLHGPIGTDFLNSNERAKLIAQRTDVLVAPILMPGNSPYHLGFPGTISLSTETIERVYFEAVQSLIGQGFKRFIIMNGHAGNTATVKFIVDRINQETPGIAVDMSDAVAPFIPKAAPLKEGMVAPFDRHAGVNEASDSLYLTPGLVNLGAGRTARLTLPPHLQAMVPAVKAGDPTATLVFLAEALKAKSTGKHTSTAEITDTGSWSELDPKTATAAQGKAFDDAYIGAAVQFIEKWKALRPMGVK